jgi:trans-AT polyketide synthase/acyltransferase/oxidoreductase domain-containing protein
VLAEPAALACDAGPAVGRLTAGLLGSGGLREAYGVRCAYFSGAMYKGIASRELVVSMGRAGMLGFLGAGGMAMSQVDADLAHICRELPAGARFGVNLLHAPDRPQLEEAMVEMLLRHGVRNADAAAFVEPTPALVHYRLKGVVRGADGKVVPPRHLMAKVSRPEVAQAFMSPAPAQMVQALLESGRLTREEAALAPELPLAGEVCVEADSAGHTDQGVAFVLLPAMLRLRDRISERHRYARPVYLGAAGGIGAPEAAAAAFVMGADFVLTGSINQCTVESGASERVKEMLQLAQVQDTTYAPAGDLFETGARVQVLRKGVFFPARANKLYDLYRQHGSIDEIDAKTRQQIEARYFKRSFDEVWAETKAYYIASGRRSGAELERNQKEKMALIFRWYFVNATRLAHEGLEEGMADYQIHCGPAMGAFNQWVQGTELEPWRNRRVAEIGLRLMDGAARVLNERFSGLMQVAAGSPL